MTVAINFGGIFYAIWLPRTKIILHFNHHSFLLLFPVLEPAK